MKAERRGRPLPTVLGGARSVLLPAAALLLASCSPGAPEPASHAAAVATSSQPAPSAAAGMQRFRNELAGFYIDYPRSMSASREFEAGYLVDDDWQVDAARGVPGTPLLMLTLAGSDKVSSGQLRIGVSDDPAAIAHCTAAPDSARSAPRVATINGIDFKHWRSGGAAMSHYLNVRSYRVLHGGRCWAIDLLLMRTNPQVYAPPRTPPFTRKEAFARLQTALHGFHFTR